MNVENIMRIENKKRKFDSDESVYVDVSNKKPPRKTIFDDNDDDELVNWLDLFIPSNPKNFDGNARIRFPEHPTFIPPILSTIESVCKNPLCNHKTYEEDPTPHTVPNIQEIRSIFDLIEMGKTFHCKKNTEYAGMNLRVMFNLVSPLTELSRLIGMENVKEHMVNQILFFLQGSHTTGKCNKCSDCVFKLPCLNNQTEMLHTVITGPPGVGKTELGKILGKVYKEMGILSKGTFKLATRSDLISGYLGQTAIKTQKVIDECKGGVLFIDEAYALGNSDLRDSFSKECIDTLNQNLSENRDFLCIIAGYEDELEKCFFKFNDGLRRRFTFRYDMVPYTHTELMNIFELKVHTINWKLCYDIEESDTPEVKIYKEQLKQNITDMFKKNSNKFPNYGGDIETLLLNCKIAHTRRCTFKGDEQRKTLSILDLETGIKTFSSHRKYEKVTKKTNKNQLTNLNLDTKVHVYSRNPY